MKRVGIFALGLCLMFCLTACGVQITGITLPESVELEVGASEALAVEYAAGEDAAEDAVAEAAGKLALVWTSSDEAVATVDAEGVVTAVAPGEVEITAASEDGKLTASCRVTVGVSVTGIAAPETLELQIGETETANLGAAVLPDNATDATLTYKSSDEAVATVGADGTVTAVGAGECEITIKAAGFGKSTAETTVKVVVKEAAAKPAATGSTSNNSYSNKSSSKNVTTATGGSTSSGGNTSVGSGTAPTTPTTPDPAPQPPVTGPATPPEGGAIGGGNDGPIPGGGSDENNGGMPQQVNALCRPKLPPRAVPQAAASMMSFPAVVLMRTMAGTLKS